MSRLTENATLVVMLLLTINVLGLNLWVISRAGSQQQTTAAATQTENHAKTNSSCDVPCQKALIATLTPSSPIVERKNIKAPHEWYVPLGSGSTQSREWVDIPGMEATIDSGNYPAMKSVMFEVYMSIPTANGVVSVKLYNITKQHDVWFSETSSETDKVIGKQMNISLDPGRNLYRVKMKSSMGYQANAANGRIIIVTE